MRGRSVGYGVGVVLLVAAAGWAVTRPPAGSPAPAPRTADGRPDLNGMWGGAGSTDVIVGEGDITYTLNSRDGSAVNFERDSTLQRRMSPNKPIYKPEYWARVQLLDINRNREDSFFSCMPAGVPRMGPPGKIVQTPTEVVFLYPTKNTFRLIPTDGRPHHPEKSLDQTWMGDSVGRWDGDTLVITTIGLNDISWLDYPGYFHTTNLRVTERLQREGNNLHYDVTAEDPGVLMEPWITTRRTLPLNTDPKAVFWEDLPCVEHDLPHIVTNERH